MIGTTTASIGGTDIVAVLLTVAGSSSTSASIHGGRGHAQNTTTAILAMRVTTITNHSIRQSGTEGVIYSLPLFLAKCAGHNDDVKPALKRFASDEVESGLDPPRTGTTRKSEGVFAYLNSTVRCNTAING